MQIRVTGFGQSGASRAEHLNQVQLIEQIVFVPEHQLVVGGGVVDRLLATGASRPQRP